MLGLPIVKLGVAFAPYGYEDDPDKEGWYRPVQSQLVALYYARLMKCRATYRDIAKWLTEATGRSITSGSLQKLFERRPPLSDYLLTLDERISIATCLTEEKAIELSPCQVHWQERKGFEARKAYIQSRTEAVERKEAIRRAEADAFSQKH